MVMLYLIAEAMAGSEYVDQASWQTAMDAMVISTSDWSALVDGQSVDGVSFSGFSLRLIAGHSLLYASSSDGINVNDNSADLTAWSVLLNTPAYGAAVSLTSVRADLSAEGYLSGAPVDSVPLTLPVSETDTVFVGVVFVGLVDEVRIVSSAVDDGLLLYTVIIDDDSDGDGYVESAGDCDDADATTYPGASELEDGLDNDCNGTIDEGTNAYDDDGDRWTESAGDCDDGNRDVNPAESEVPNNGTDDDCNETTPDVPPEPEDDTGDDPKGVFIGGGGVCGCDSAGNLRKLGWQALLALVLIWVVVDLRPY